MCFVFLMLNSTKILDDFRPKFWQISDKNFDSETFVFVNFVRKCSDARKLLDEMLPKLWKISDQTFDSFSGDENVFLDVPTLFVLQSKCEPNNLSLRKEVLVGCSFLSILQNI